MNSNKKLIPISALVVFSTITLASLEENGELPGSEQWLGFAISYFILSAMSDLGLPVAGGLAVLIMITTLLVRGDSALKFANVSVKQQARRTAASRRERRDGRFGDNRRVVI